MFGVGLIAELTDEEILSRADPDDADGDGISGRPNFDRGFVGRFRPQVPDRLHRGLHTRAAV